MTEWERKRCLTNFFALVYVWNGVVLSCLYENILCACISGTRRVRVLRTGDATRVHNSLVHTSAEVCSCLPRDWLHKSAAICLGTDSLIHNPYLLVCQYSKETWGRLERRKNGIALTDTPQKVDIVRGSSQAKRRPDIIANKSLRSHILKEWNYAIPQLTTDALSSWCNYLRDALNALDTAAMVWKIGKGTTNLILQQTLWNKRYTTRWIHSSASTLNHYNNVAEE